MLELNDLTCGYRMDAKRTKTVLEHISLTVGNGEIWCILGANGIGKTTLFRTILGGIPPLGGTMTCDGEKLDGMPRRLLAKKIAYVPQYHTPPFPFTVKEIVLMGRSVYLDTFHSPEAEDVQIAEEVMEELGILHLKDEIYTEISGGERQMGLIARAIAQQPGMLLMDEPASNLDYGNQVQILKQMQLLSEKGISILFSSHHPEHAFLCGAHAAAITGKNEIVTGMADTVITPELIRRMYGIRSKVIEAETEEGKTVKNIFPFL